ncbi:hypothetical protein [Enterobacter hormaechei]|uniref:hypothetical protein n=1 Tax=Enterobacter hormaechei TaxID=158836 RepID=UPI001363D506|nr:hypothetical protein [Enterobacter hormaechei]QHI58107.1 hypothetical protein GTQ93_12025 [Enterobacter hormaechei]
MPRGLISGVDYSDKDILDSHVYPKMKGEPLVDANDCIVIPVRNAESPHFRKMGGQSFGVQLGKAENNPTHNNCVNALHEKLNSGEINKITISTYVFGSDNKPEEQVFFISPNGSQYKWFKEANARNAFHDGTYIQPDIGGRDVNKFFPTAVCPNIIIEVIRTHSPERDTFEKLLELSKTNHYVLFYFIGENKKSSVLNNFYSFDGELKIRVSHYLINGQVFKNGIPYSKQGKNQTFEKWYEYLNSSYFTFAKEKSKKNNPTA